MKTQEEIDKAKELEETRSWFLGATAQKEEPKPDTEPETEAAPEPEEKQPEQPSDKPEEKPEEPKPEDKPLPFKVREIQKQDSQDIAEIAARTAAEVVGQMNKKAEPDPAPPEDPYKSLGRNGEYFRKLESLMPEKYSGLGHKITEFKAKEQEYKQKWLEENPDEEFDRTSREHKKFYDKNEPVVTPDDFEVAKEQVIIEKAERNIEERLRPKLEAQEAKEKQKEAQPKIASELTSTLYDVLGSLDEGLKDVATRDPDLASLEESNPAEAMALAESSSTFVPLLGIAASIAHGVKVSPDDPNLTSLSKVWQSIEQEYAGSTVKDQKTGQTLKFATVGEWAAMTPVQKQKHYCLTINEVQARLKGWFTEDVKNRATKYRALASKLGGGAGKATHEAGARTVQEATQTTVAKTPARSPSAGSSGSQVPSKVGVGVSKEKSVRPGLSWFA